MLDTEVLSVGLFSTCPQQDTDRPTVRAWAFNPGLPQNYQRPKDLGHHILLSVLINTNLESGAEPGFEPK